MDPKACITSTLPVKLSSQPSLPDFKRQCSVILKFDAHYYVKLYVKLLRCECEMLAYTWSLAGGSALEPHWKKGFTGG